MSDESIVGMPTSEVSSGTAAIFFADIAHSTAITERLGDAAFRAKARELSGALRALIRECAGTRVEGPTLGDGVLAVFTSAREAIEATRRCAKAGDDAGLSLHLGLHAGDITREKDPDGRDNISGGAVNIAARVAGLSAAGEVRARCSSRRRCGRLRAPRAGWRSRIEAGAGSRASASRCGCGLSSPARTVQTTPDPHRGAPAPASAEWQQALGHHRVS
jgi:class 3 adenylate cyclase